MKNLKNYLFVAAATLFGIVGCNTLKQEVTTTHNITTNNTPGTTTKITTKTDRRTHETIATTSSVSSTTCDSCICLNFPYKPGKKLDDDNTAAQYIGYYGYWAGQSRKRIDSITIRDTPRVDQSKIHGLLGWNIPFGDIKALLDAYKSDSSSNTDTVGFAVYIALTASTDYNKDLSIASNIEQGMQKTHLILVLTAGGKVRTDLGYHDLITPCPNMCDSNTTLANKYKEEYNKGLNNQPPGK